MWLYVPSVCLPGSEVSTLPSMSPEGVSASVTWRGKLSLPQVWSRRWKRASFLTRLSGPTLPPSTVARGAERWISSLPARPASPTPAPDNAKDSMTTAAAPSSSTSLASSERSTHPWSSWKTSASGSQVDIFETSESAYQDWVTESRRRSLSLREALERRIGGSGFSFWPTVTQDSATQRSGKYAQGGEPLAMAAANRPTVTVSNRKLEVRITERNAFATAWPTPKARDHNGGKGATERHSPDLDKVAEHYFSHPDQTTTTPGAPSSSDGRTSRLRLNPAFTCWLMGWPTLWTHGSISCELQATEWFLWRQQSLSMFFYLTRDESVLSKTA